MGAKPPVEREPYSLYVCGLKNPVRKRLIEIVEHKLFEVRILIHEQCFIIASMLINDHGNVEKCSKHI